MEVIKSALNIFTADEWNSLGTLVSIFTSVFVFIPGLFAFLKRNLVAEEALREREREAHRQRILSTLMNMKPEIYDLQTFAQRVGSKTINNWERFKFEIERRRADNTNKKIFCEFDELKDNLMEYYRSKGREFTPRKYVQKSQVKTSESN